MSVSNPGDDNKFAVFSASSIQVHAESIGISELPSDLLQHLAEDASYRLREIVSKSCEFMRHSRRNNLKSSDVEKALHWSNAEPICGVDTSIDFNSCEKIYCLDDPILDLRQLAFQNLKAFHKPQISLRTQWLTKGQVEQIDKPKTEEKADEETQDTDIKEVYTDYYRSLVECIFCDNQILFDEMIADMRKNSKIGPVVPYLANFVASTNLVSHDLMKLSKMLCMIRALLFNSYISLQLYMKPFFNSVMYCVLEPLAASINPLNDHWLLRDYGAFLICQIIYSYPSESEFFLSRLESSIEETLLDSTRPLCSHYGALMTLFHLSVSMIRKVLLPILVKYTAKYLLPFMEDTSPTNTNLKEDAHKVLGAIVLCVEKLHFQHDSERLTKQFCFPNIKTDCCLTELFGEALVTRLPLHDFSFESENSRKFKKRNDVPVSLPGHQCIVYRQTPSDRNALNLPKVRKRKLSDVFVTSSLKQYHQPIHINFGVALPVKSRYNRIKQDQTETTPAAGISLSFHLMRRKFSKLKQHNGSASLLSWL